MPLLAQERGIQVGHKVGAAEPGFEATVGVRVDTARGRTRVMGALAAGRDGRVIRIDEFPVDVVPEGWMLVIRNRDVPGVIGRVGTVLGEAGVNIGSYHQARRAGGGEALAAIAVDQRVGDAVLGRLAALPDVLQVHLADLGG
jgi:L-serine deaminase